MLLSRRAFRTFAGIFTASALLAISFQPVIPQGRGRPAPLALRDGQEITFTAPQFVVHALWFKANDETNYAWMGSDEVYAVWSDLQPDHADYVTSTYGNVDEGDLVNFRSGDRCMAPQGRVDAAYPRRGCQGGLAELNLRYSFWEQDGPYPAGLEFCPGSFPGDHHTLQNGKCDSDDLIGWGAIVHDRNELLAMLPSVGASREFTHVMDKESGKYRFRYRITRIADAERSIVIHLPPDLGLPPSITLQAMPGSGFGGSVTLTWSGATSASVDIYRNGAIVVTTPNDGNHVDAAGSGTHQYRLCNQGSTGACSPQVQVVVP
jgi:hypothetical protein